MTRGSRSPTASVVTKVSRHSHVGRAQAELADAEASARARQFAEYMFSPGSVAEATWSVYTSLLARDR